MSARAFFKLENTEQLVAAVLMYGLHAVFAYDSRQREIRPLVFDFIMPHGEKVRAESVQSDGVGDVSVHWGTESTGPSGTLVFRHWVEDLLDKGESFTVNYLPYPTRHVPSVIRWSLVRKEL